MVAATFSAHRALSVTAAGSLLVGLVHSFGPANSSVLVFTLDAAGYTLALALAVTAATVGVRRLPQLDAITLVTGVILALTRFDTGALRSLSGTDEHILGQLAMRTLLAGRNPYAHPYPQVGANGFGTPLLRGGQADTYGYPPLQLEIGRVLGVVSDRLANPGVVDAIALVGLSVAVFWLLPVALRPLAVVSVLGLDLITPNAVSGLPAVLALALLCVPLYRWTATAVTGRLGRLGLLQAVGLGLACAAQQLSWFVAPFLLLGLFLLRRGTLGNARAAGVVARYVTVTAATFALVNLPFIIADPGAWARAMTTTLTQNAIVEGVGWALPVIELDGGTGRLAMLAFAAVLLLAGLLLVFAVGFRRLAPAVAILPWVAFLVSSRSNPEYFYMFVPLWLVGAVQVDRDLVAASAPLRLPRRIAALPHPIVTRVAAIAVILAPAVVAFVGGVTGQPPVTVVPVRVVLSGSTIDEIVVDVTNHTSRPLSPQYFIDALDSITEPWVPRAGPTPIAPHSHRLVALRARTASQPASVAGNLWAFTTVADPSGIAATELQVPLSHVTVKGLATSRGAARQHLLCLARLVTTSHC